MNEILSMLRERAELTVIDAPPVMAVTDASIMAPKMDGVILIIRPGKTKISCCQTGCGATQTNARQYNWGGVE